MFAKEKKRRLKSILQVITTNVVIFIMRRTSIVSKASIVLKLQSPCKIIINRKLSFLKKQKPI
jgi:hypothetical protein